MTISPVLKIMPSQAGPEDTASNVALREALLEALSELTCPAYTDELAPYLRARHGRVYRTLSATRIEREVEGVFHRYGAEDVSPSEPSLCTAITAEHGESIMKLIARTDWPLTQRVVAATTGRVRHLLITARLCELAIKRKSHFAEHRALLRLTAAHARGLPDAVVWYNKYDLAGWLGLSLELIKASSGEDEEERAGAAARLSSLPGFHPIFGMPDERLEVRGV